MNPHDDFDLHDTERWWVWRDPDGGAVKLSPDTPRTKQVELELLLDWYAAKIAPIRERLRKAEFELMTGQPYEETRL